MNASWAGCWVVRSIRPAHEPSCKKNWNGRLGIGPPYHSPAPHRPTRGSTPTTCSRTAASNWATNCWWMTPSSRATRFGAARRPPIRDRSTNRRQTPRFFSEGPAASVQLPTGLSQLRAAVDKTNFSARPTPVEAGMDRRTDTRRMHPIERTGCRGNNPGFSRDSSGTRASDDAREDQGRRNHVR